MRVGSHVNITVCNKVDDVNLAKQKRVPMMTAWRGWILLWCIAGSAGVVQIGLFLCLTHVQTQFHLSSGAMCLHGVPADCTGVKCECTTLNTSNTRYKQ